MSRILSFFKELSSLGADAALLHAPHSILYFSGFTGGEGVLVLTEDRRILLTDSRYTLQAKREAPDFEILPHDTRLAPLLAGQKSIAIEEDFLSLAAYEKLQSQLPEKEWMHCSETILQLRRKKDIGELSAITEAVRLADNAFQFAVSRISPGMREYEVAALLEGYMRRNAGATPAFETICASGARSALPHGAASDKRLEKGDFLTMDFGCLLQGYSSDITRTVTIGPASDRQKEIYGIVLYAQTKAENAATGGMPAAELDKVARDVIGDYGYGDYFGHALGHGVGLAVHEHPILSPRSRHRLTSGDVFTIEPGIYIPDFGGVRIEDMLYATENGYAVLTKASKELLEIL